MKALKLEAGVYMDSKEELLEAIEHYSVYTKNRRKILKFLVQIETEGKAMADVNTLAKMFNISTTAGYHAIKFFEKDNMLQVIPSANNKINNFLLKRPRLNEIQNFFEKSFKKLWKNLLTAFKY